MSQEKSKTPDVVMLPEHERYDIRSTFISQEEADELVRKGSTDSLPNFLGKLDKDAADKSKNGNVRSA